MLLTLDPAGRNVRWQEGGLYQSLAEKGYAVCAADLRGIGDLTPEVGRGSPRYARSHADEENYAWASLIFGKPMLGQRVSDILVLVRALRAYSALGGRPLMLLAAGQLAPPALFAAALEPGIHALYLAGCLVSYRNLVDTEQYHHAFANFVPRLLLHTDLPDIAASIAPRRVCLAGAVDATGVTMDEAAVRAIYQAPSNVVVRPKAAWDLESLTSWYS